MEKFEETRFLTVGFDQRVPNEAKEQDGKFLEFYVYGAKGIYPRIVS
jgi:hypothetical protein